MQIVILLLYLLSVLAFCLNSVRKLRTNPIGWVIVSEALALSLIHVLLGFYFVRNHESFISVFSDWGVFTYFFFMGVFVLLLCILWIVGLVIKIRYRIKNAVKVWFWTAVKLACLMTVSFVAVLQVPYILYCMQYEYIEETAQVMLDEYIEERYPQARIVRFDQDISSGMFDSALVGFYSTICIDGEYYDIEVGRFEQTWNPDLQIVYDEYEARRAWDSAG